jgi:hypothetical protein
VSDPLARETDIAVRAARDDAWMEARASIADVLTAAEQVIRSVRAGDAYVRDDADALERAVQRVREAR